MGGPVVSGLTRGLLVWCGSFRVGQRWRHRRGAGDGRERRRDDSKVRAHFRGGYEAKEVRRRPGRESTAGLGPPLTWLQKAETSYQAC